MTTLLDANVLIALLVADHVHHHPAETWFTGGTVERFATCPSTQGTLIRLLLHKGQPPDAAKAVLTALCDDDRHEFWPDAISYRQVPLTGVIGHRQVTDAYLAQLTRTHNGRLATFDQGLAKLHRDITDLVPTNPPPIPTR